MYIADYNNYRIRKVNPAGIITSIAGNGTVGFSGDGGMATNAKIQSPYGVAADLAGNVFIDDYSNQRIRIVNASGIINTFAGNGTAGFSGDGGLATIAELNNPYRVTVNAGVLYIADRTNQRIRSVPYSVGIEQLSINNEQPTIYPNPTSDLFFIDANTTDKLNVDLYDVNGRYVFSKSAIGKSTIDVTTLNEGVYFLIIKTTDRVINKKLVIVR